MLMAYPSRVWRSGGTRNCFTCGDSGHLAKNCPQAAENKTHGDVSCYLCGEKGHKKRDCPHQGMHQNAIKNGGENGTVKETRRQEKEKRPERETGQWSGSKESSRHGRRNGETRPLGKDISCFLCGEKGHKRRDCPQQGFQDKEISTAKVKMDTAKKADIARQDNGKDSMQIEGTLAVRAQPTTAKDIEHSEEPDEGDVVRSKNDVTINKPTGASAVQDKGTRMYQYKGPMSSRNDHQLKHDSDRRYRNSGRNQFNEFASLPSYIDTHCHLEYVLERSYLNKYGDLKRKFGYPENFRGCITSFCDPPAFSSFGLWKELLEEDGVWGTFGVHPRHARAYTDKMEEAIITCLGHSKCVGFGEMGLDYSDHCVNESPADVQNQVLKRLLRLAPVMGKPLVLHCRDAEEDLLQCLTVAGLPRDWKIHLHCYSGSLRMARRFLDAFPNIYFGFTGQITYRKSEENRGVAAELPADRILLETDSPYLTPASFKDRDFKNCHPPMAGAVAIQIARARDEPIDRMMTTLLENCTSFYGV